MDADYVRRKLETQADNVHRSLLLEYGQTPDRERVVETDGEFPAAVEDLFPWATVTLLTDPGRERVLLVESAAEEFDWEPPGGRGDREESAETTARRGAVEAVGADPRIEGLSLVERLQLDFGREDGLTAPVVQAVFHGVVDGDHPATEGEPRSRWFDRGQLPERVRFRETLRRVLADGESG